MSDTFPGSVGFAADTAQPNAYGPIHNPQQIRPSVRRVGLAIQHMLRHLNEPLRVSTLAALTGLSPSHFFSLFKSVTGFTPIAFFIGLRVQRACELLADPQSNIKRAAELVGYNDRYYFTRVFKQVMGVPPGAYRRTVLNSPALTGVGASSQGAREDLRRPSMAFALSTIKDLGLVPAADSLQRAG